MATVAQEIVAFFQSKGFSRTAAAGIAGNAMQESTDNPSAAGGGLFQDIGPRAPSGQGSLSHQLEAAYSELRSSPKTVERLQASKTPQEAARVFSEEFERPGEPNLPNRERYAAEAYNGRSDGSSGEIIPGEYSLPVIGGILKAVGGAGEQVGHAVNEAAGVNTVEGIIGAITSPSTWLRLAEGVGGIILFMVGLKTLTKGTAIAGAGNIVVDQGRGVKRGVKRAVMK